MVKRSEALDQTYGALAHPIRRELLELLRCGPTRVTHLAEPFDVSLVSASKHIRVLESAGLVRRQITGRDHVVSLQTQPLIEAHDWIERYRSFWEDRLDALEAELRARRTS